MKNSTKYMVKKYGKKKCKLAYNLHIEGNGAQTIGYDLNINTNAADGLINAGRDLNS